MKSLLASVFLASAAILHAQDSTPGPNSLFIQQINDTVTAAFPIYIHPPSSSSGIFVFQSGTTRPFLLPYAGGITVNSGTLTLDNIPQSAVASLSTDLADKQDASPFLTELSTIGTMNPDEAIRTNSSGDFVAESPANFRSWIGAMAQPAGTTAQYIRGDGTLATFPLVPSAQVNSDWNSVSGVSQILNKPTLATVATTGAYADLTGKPTLFSGTYADLAGKPTLVTTATSTAPGLTLNVAGSAINLTGTATTAARITATPTRSLNTAFQISSTRDAIVSYAVDIASTLTLSGGATGTVVLEYADDSGITTNVTTVQSTANGNTGALTIGLSLTQTATGSLSGYIPAGKYVRIRTVNTAGTPSFTYRTAQETLL